MSERRRKLRWIRPNVCVKDIFDIDFLKLWRDGFRALVFDIDHTLTSTKSWRVTVKTRRKLKELQKMGFKIVFLTNTVVPWRKKRARAITESAKIKNVILVCCNLIPFHCKPRCWGFLRACRLAGVAVKKTVMVGDMLLYDILGAQNARYGYTILVEPRGPDNIFIFRSRKKEREIKEWLAEIGLLRS